MDFSLNIIQNNEEPEVFFIKIEEDKETLSVLYHIFVRTVKKVLKEFRSNVFSPREESATEILYKYLKVRVFSDIDEYIDKWYSETKNPQDEAESFFEVLSEQIFDSKDEDLIKEKKQQIEKLRTDRIKNDKTENFGDAYFYCFDEDRFWDIISEHM